MQLFLGCPLNDSIASSELDVVSLNNQPYIGKSLDAVTDLNQLDLLENHILSILKGKPKLLLFIIE